MDNQLSKITFTDSEGGRYLLAIVFIIFLIFVSIIAYLRPNFFENSIILLGTICIGIIILVLWIVFNQRIIYVGNKDIIIKDRFLNKTYLKGNLNELVGYYAYKFSSRTMNWYVIAIKFPKKTISFRRDFPTKEPLEEFQEILKNSNIKKINEGNEQFPTITMKEAQDLELIFRNNK